MAYKSDTSSMSEEDFFDLLSVDEGSDEDFLKESVDESKKEEEEIKVEEEPKVTDLTDEELFETLEASSTEDENSEEASSPEDFKNATLKSILEWRLDKLKLDKNAAFEGIEEFNEETFEELFDQLVEFEAQERYENLKNQDEDIKAFIEVLENGGGIDQLNILRNQRIDISEIDTSTTEGKISKIKKYYKEIKGMDSESIDDLLEVIQNKNKIDSELQKVDQLYSQHFNKERQRVVDQQKELNQRRINQENALYTGYEQILNEEKFPKKEKDEIIDFVFNKKHRLTTGELISEFDKQLLIKRHKPQELHEIVLFLKDKDKYNEKVINSYKNNKTNSRFNSIFERSGGKVKKETNKQLIKEFSNF